MSEVNDFVYIHDDSNPSIHLSGVNQGYVHTKKDINDAINELKKLSDSIINEDEYTYLKNIDININIEAVNAPEIQIWKTYNVFDINDKNDSIASTIGAGYVNNVPL